MLGKGSRAGRGGFLCEKRRRQFLAPAGMTFFTAAHRPLLCPCAFDEGKSRCQACRPGCVPFHCRAQTACAGLNLHQNLRCAGAGAEDRQHY